MTSKFNSNSINQSDHHVAEDNGEDGWDKDEEGNFAGGEAVVTNHKGSLEWDALERFEEGGDQGFADEEEEEERRKRRVAQQYPGGVMPQWRMATLSAWQFAISAVMASLVPVLWPKQVLAIVGEANKGTALGFMQGISTAIGIIMGMVVAQLSDHSRTPIGRRAPYVIGGTIASVFFLVVMIWSGDMGRTGLFMLILYTLLGIGFQCGYQSTIAAYQPLLPDLVPMQQMSTATGWTAMTGLIGNCFGAVGIAILLPLLGAPALALLYGAILFGSAIILPFTNKEHMSRKTPESNRFCINTRELGFKRFFSRLIQAFMESSDFRWLFFTRFLAQMGWSFINGFVFYYIRDAVPHNNRTGYLVFGVSIGNQVETAAGIFMVTALLVGSLSGYAGGFLADRYGKKKLIYLSTVLQGISGCILALLCIWPHDFGWSLIGAAFYGAGLGAFLAVDMALVVECLPSFKRFGNDTFLFHLAGTIPAALGTPLGGLVLDNGRRLAKVLDVPNLEYTFIFAINGLFLFLCAVFITKVRAGTAPKTTGGNEVEGEAGSIAYSSLAVDTLTTDQSRLTPRQDFVAQTN